MDASGPGGADRREKAALVVGIGASAGGLEALQRQPFEQFTMTSAHGRMVFVNLDVGYLVVITKMEMRLEQVLIEVESAARKIRGMGKRI